MKFFTLQFHMRMIYFYMSSENGSTIGLTAEHALPTSVGTAGIDFLRSFGRAYFNVEQRIADQTVFQHTYETFTKESLEHGRRRHVFRARVSEEVGAVVENGNYPLEVALPLHAIDDATTDHIIVVADDIESISVPEWNAVYQYWRSPFTHDMSFDRMTRAVDHGGTQFHLTNQPNEQDIDTLAKLWFAFGWTRPQISDYVQARSFDTGSAWFSGVRDRTTNQLVAACCGEQLNLSGVSIVESTEWATAAGYEGHGLCQASVTGLIAQILADTEYAGRGTPLIMGEFNMTSRADMVARSVGMTIPYVEGVHGLENTPRQVMRQNVSVFDRHPRNNRSFSSLQESERVWFRDAYRGVPYTYLRNFIVGMLPKSRINTLYTKNAVENILSMYI